jgi:Protein of unknown function (DUF3987)
LIGNARWGSPWDGWSEPPIIWSSSVGNPSSGKSPGLDAIRDLIGSIESDANTDHKDNLADWDTQKRRAKIKLEVWAEDCKRALKDNVMEPPKPTDAEEPPRPSRKRNVTNDPTVEKVARIILENPKGLMLFRDELAGWIGALDKYGGAGGDRAFYLESYGGRAYAVDRMKDPEPIVIPALTVAIMGGIQPDRLATLVLSGDDDGLAARFIYMWPERIPPQRPTRLPGMAVRLATILEHLHWCGDNEQSAQPPTSISARATIAAIAILNEYAAPMARRCFGEAALPEVDRDTKVLAQWTRQQANGPIGPNGTEVFAVNARDLRHAGVLNTKEVARYEAAISELEAAGWLRPRPRRAGDNHGRRRKDWEVNPRLRGDT